MAIGLSGFDIIHTIIITILLCNNNMKNRG